MPFDVPEVLLRVHNMLEVRLLHREAKQLCARVVAEQTVSARLLRSVLPLSIAERLKEHRSSTWSAELVTDGYAEVTVLFADLVEFTKYVEGASAAILRSLLDDISAGFDSLAGGRVLDREAVLDNGWLTCVGLSDPVAVRTVRAAQKAMDLLEAISRFNAHSHYKLRVSIGMGTQSGEPGGNGRARLHAL
jgi:adenylate cyclase